MTLQEKSFEKIQTSFTTIEELYEAKAHLGHAQNKTDALFTPYTLSKTEKNDNVIINLSKTLLSIKQSCEILYKAAQNNKNILFLSGSNQSKDLVVKYAKIAMQHYMLSWPGGLITNFKSVLQSKNIAFNLIKKNEVLTTKKAIAIKNQKDKKLQKKYIGIKDIEKTPGAIVIVNAKNHKTAILEAQSKNIPVITLIDSNTKPLSKNIIPINLSSQSSIEIVLRCMSQNILEGTKKAIKTNNKTVTTNKKNNFVKKFQVNN